MTTKSIYVSRLRRAFLLRAHPDRFRSQPNKISAQQASLLQALSARWSQDDFLAYVDNHGEQTRPHTFSSRERLPLPFVLEGKDGSLVKHTLNLQQPAHGILTDMAKALQSTGTTIDLPPEPSPTVASSTSNRNAIYCANIQDHPPQRDESFDIHSAQGRNLLAFFQKKWDPVEMQRRQEARLDVTAVALVVRRAYGFKAVDGTGLGWSSASLAQLLRSLLLLHEEHSTKFHVRSFYPLRLVWSSEIFEEELDVYGGTLFLNPASTAVQLLEVFLKVTSEGIRRHKELQQQQREYLNIVASRLGVQLVKGHSCQAKDYFEFVHRLVEFLEPLHDEQTPQYADGSDQTAVALQRIAVKVEAATRRAMVTSEGEIRVGENMTMESVISGIARHGVAARKQRAEYEQRKQDYKAAVHRAKWELGVEGVRSHRPVSLERVLDAVRRLLSNKSPLIRRRLAGNKLGVASSGQFCHVGDDGSIVIPWDWN